jgi:hypothetical protein
MWNLTSTDLELAKEELKGRRAAVEARYTKDIQGLDADLAEIEMLERIATAFALKHKTEGVGNTTTSEAEPGSEPNPVLELPSLRAPGPDRVGKHGETSRWRLSLPDRSDASQV